MLKFFYFIIALLTFVTLILGLYDRYAPNSEADNFVSIIIVPDVKQEKEIITPDQNNKEQTVLSKPIDSDYNNMKVDVPFFQPPPLDNLAPQQITNISVSQSMFTPGPGQYVVPESKINASTIQEPYFTPGPAQY